MKLPVIGVMGSGKQEHKDLSEPLGEWLASLPVHLLTGGGKGVMTAVSRAFERVTGREGMIIGILPMGKEGYPNPHVELPIQTHLSLSGVRGSDPLSRNHINVLSSDLIIALPGSHGTASEVKLALEYKKPVLAFVNNKSDIPDLPAKVPHTNDLEQLKDLVAISLDLIN